MSKKMNFPVVPLAEVSMNDTVVHMGDRRPMVLIVDDEKVIADTLSIIISKSGFDTMTAYDATTALALAKATPPDLLISDVVMPGMTGVELAITMSQLHPACRVLLFSGQAATIDLLAKARESGHDFTTLTKPVHPTDMLRRITQSLAIPDDITSSSASNMAFSNPQFISHLGN
jgi:DNA-binding NtrC family response regulator